MKDKDIPRHSVVCRYGHARSGTEHFLSPAELKVFMRSARKNPSVVTVSVDGKVKFTRKFNVNDNCTVLKVVWKNSLREPLWVYEQNLLALADEKRKYEFKNDVLRVEEHTMTHKKARRLAKK